MIRELEQDNELDLDKALGKVGYSSSKKGKLDHLVGNILGSVMLSVYNNLSLDRQEAKQRFLLGLTEAQAADDYQHITGEVLIALLNRAQEVEWDDNQQMIGFSQFLTDLQTGK